jgi:hypothetical protein
VDSGKTVHAGTAYQLVAVSSIEEDITSAKPVSLEIFLGEVEGAQVGVCGQAIGKVHHSEHLNGSAGP